MAFLTLLDLLREKSELQTSCVAKKNKALALKFHANKKYTRQGFFTFTSMVYCSTRFLWALIKLSRRFSKCSWLLAN